MTPAKGGQMSDETKQPEFTSGSCSAPCDHMSLSELAETIEAIRDAMAPNARALIDEFGGAVPLTEEQWEALAAHVEIEPIAREVAVWAAAEAFLRVVRRTKTEPSEAVGVAPTYYTNVITEEPATLRRSLVAHIKDVPS